MSEPTITSLTAMVESLNALYAAQAAEIASLREALSKAPALKPKAPAHEPGSWVDPPKFRTIRGVKERAYHGRGYGVIGWRACQQAQAPQAPATQEPPPWATEDVPM